jgi:hypothetical protein
MKILIACEESQTVCKAFRAKGHEAFSCDILPCSGGHPEWHVQRDIRGILPTNGFDMVIAFPPCTDLAVSGARWFKEQRADSRQLASIQFFIEMHLAIKHCGRGAIENPIGIMSTHLRKPEQIIQPWQFGHGETKSTCLWLYGLPPLKPTNIVEGREGRVWKMPPSPDRAKLRSKTFQGIADAMADQWG